jgi:glutathione S-transferase
MSIATIPALANFEDNCLFAGEISLRAFQDDVAMHGECGCRALLLSSTGITMSNTHAPITLYQFPLSHYCEKTRWQLDVKGITYRAVNLFPGMHTRFTRKLAATNTVPILKDGHTIVADSTEIALYLEKTYRLCPLLPADELARHRVLELEAMCDQIGDDVRRWVYGQLLSHPELGRVLFSAYSPGKRLLGRALTPLFRLGLQKLYRVYPNKIKQSEQKMWQGLDHLAREMNGRTSGYLVGDRLSLADIAAAAMYGPLLGPKGTPWQDTGTPPPEFARAVAKARAHPAGQWLMWLYENARHVKRDDA